MEYYTSGGDFLFESGLYIDHGQWENPGEILSIFTTYSPMALHNSMD